MERLDGVSCASDVLCVAIDGTGNVLTTTDPTDGTPIWTSTPADGTNYLTAISCPSVLLCVAVDNVGYVVISTDPTAPSPTWTATNIDPGGYLAGVSCPSTSLCVAIDHQGNVLSSTDPTDPTPAWSSTAVDGVSALDAVSCSSDSLCVVTDGYGNVLTGAPPSTLQVEIAGGSGSVSGGGVACPGTCSATVEQGSQVTLTATPADGYEFAGWSGGGCSGSGSCVTTVDSPDQVTATFTAIPSTSGGSSGGGSSGGAVSTTPEGKPPARVPLTRTQLTTALKGEIAPAGRAATIAALLRAGSYTFKRYQLPEGGKLTISWDAKAAHGKMALIASGSLAMPAAGTGKLIVRLTVTGRRLLRGTTKLRVTGWVTFTPYGQPKFTAKRGFTLSGSGSSAHRAARVLTARGPAQSRFSPK